MDSNHLSILDRGTAAWNEWRAENPHIRPDLSNANLLGKTVRNANLSGCDLRGLEANGNHATIGATLLGCNFDESDLSRANLRSAVLRHSTFRRANLTGANITKADLYHVTFSDSNMHQVDLWGSSLTNCEVNGAKLTNARLRGTAIIQSSLKGVDLTGSLVYGCSVWDADLEGAVQRDLIITPSSETQCWNGKTDSTSKFPAVTADNLEVAQLIYLLLRSDGIRSVIETVGQRGVLILGRFSRERKKVLEALRNELRAFGFIPLLFDFEKPTQRDFTETVRILAGMSRFIVADITNPKSSPLELQAIVPDYMIPLVPIIEEGESPFSMFADIRSKYNDWVLDVLEYDSVESLISNIEAAIIRPALERSDDLLLRKAAQYRSRHVKDYREGIRRDHRGDA
jgi:uncharacterized protein YjbI with pentapeptide repeats